MYTKPDDMIKIVSRKGPGDKRWTTIKDPKWERYETVKGRRGKNRDAK